ncbi:TWiK family of potassium channels protein 18-like [Watersipora subatra]|uniref:TWiK family of potassium channels protein 18-like n=1 Tax=Watersipora subatra TaxID=2589382 RepID=UPI00355B6486
MPGGPQYAWSWSGSLVFAMTVTTTIGYGVIAPKTPWGRLVCIAYAILGMPIMLICLANVGDIMADIFRFAYATVCCCGCCRSKPKKQQDDMELTPVSTYRTDASGRPIIDDDDESDDEDDDEDEENEGDITVPLTISMLVLFSFIFLGAALFYVWESWGFIDALYFCFITFSTIGFGDIVPGTTNLDSPESQAQLIVTGVYQILGMAMVSMCFQLMQDEIVAKVRWLLIKIGVEKKPENDQVQETGTESTAEKNKEEPPSRPMTAIRKK